MKLIFKLIKIVISLALTLVVAFALLLAFLTFREYNPDDVEALSIHAGADGAFTVSPGTQLTLATWNIGYGALGDNADFFMDNGSMVYSADKDRVKENLKGITEILKSMDPDVILLQEIDLDSSRSYHTDETALMSETFPGYDHTFAYNFKVDFIPYPIPPIGKVESGIMTLSRYRIESADRIKLPCPFKWPVRIANLKRCLVINRIPVEGTDKELVIINLHLEAFDDGEGKIEQTKMLAGILKEEAEKGNYVIAGGDFNQSFSSTDLSAYPALEGTWHSGLLDEASFDDRLIFCQDSSNPTGRSLDRPLAGADRSSFQYYVIDGFIVSDNVKVESFETVNCDFRYTDHNPVVLKVTLE